MSAILPGQRVGAYEIVAEVRGGGMASLFLGRRLGPEGFSRLVAIKVIHPHLATDRGFVEMFLDEARLSSRIVHPNVVRVEELGEHEGTYFLAMEFVHGATLSALMSALQRAKKPLPVEVACAIAMRTADGLHAAHEVTDEQGVSLEVIHRDVSPQNILLSDSGHVKLIDFGVARARGRRQSSEAGALKGKLGYMAPEQAWGRDIDRRADVYALGVVLWEMLSGRRLITGDSDIAVLEAARSPKITPPHELVSSINVALSNAVMTALAPAADDRFQTANAFRRAIGNACPAAIAVEPETISRLLKSVLEAELERERYLLHSEPRASYASMAPAEPSSRDVATRASTPSAVREQSAEGSSPPTPIPTTTVAGPRRTPWATVALAAVALVALGAGSAFVAKRTRRPTTPNRTPIAPATTRTPQSICDEKVTLDVIANGPSSVSLDTRNRPGGRFNLGALRIGPSPEVVVEARIGGVGTRAIEFSTVNTGTDARFDNVLAIYRGPCDPSFANRLPDVVGDDQPAALQFRARTALRAQGGDVLTVVVAGFGGVYGGRVDRGLVQLDATNGQSRAPTIESVRFFAGDHRAWASLRGGDPDSDLASLRVRLFDAANAPLRRFGADATLTLDLDAPADTPRYANTASADVGNEIVFDQARSAEIVAVDRVGNESAPVRVPAERGATVGPGGRSDESRICGPDLSRDVHGRCQATLDQVRACDDAQPLSLVERPDRTLHGEFEGRILPERGLFSGACYRNATRGREQIVKLRVPRGTWRVVASSDDRTWDGGIRPDPDTIIYLRRSCLDSTHASAPIAWCNDDIAFRENQRSTVIAENVSAGDLFVFVEIWGGSLADGQGVRYTLSVDLEPISAAPSRASGARDARCPSTAPTPNELCRFERLECSYPGSSGQRACACIRAPGNVDVFTWQCDRDG